MTSDSAADLNDRAIAPVYLVIDNEMVLDGPIRDVWLHILNYPSWQNYAEVRHVSGTPGKEGEVVSLVKAEDGFVFPPYYARTIKLDPPNRVVWKTFIEKGTHEIDRFGIIDFRLHDLGERTRFCSHLYYEFLVPYRDEAELDAFRKQQEENFRVLQTATRPRLRELVSRRAASQGA
ncbi:hypothetical protein [Rhodoligotrophos defluvii]|uniref:hypothetical protein n=1 Tax=Rhodoligotrophos defluvii TaxID=2561934 RepID=UPI0010C9A7A7|nr:hypothetical protein [Rhodoligotrophos defluvii]